MRSKAQYALDEYNRPVVQVEIHSTDGEDVRDVIATRFKEAFSHYSGLATVRFFKDSEEGPQKAYILPLPLLYKKKERLHFHLRPDDYLCQIPSEQIEDLMELFKEELARRADDAARVQKATKALTGK